MDGAVFERKIEETWFAVDIERGRKSMKVLVLSCNTGQGHNTAAHAVMEELERRNVECEMRDALAFSSELTSRLVSNTYIRMATDAPKVFGRMYQVGEALSNPHVKSPVYMANMAYTRKLGRYINENGFEAVVTSHLFPTQALTHLARHGQITARTYFITTDYTCHPFTEDVEPDRYFIAHPDLIEDYVERSVPKEKICATGIPVSARFQKRMERAEARDRLKMGMEEKAFLVMTGSMGAGHTSRTVETILQEGGEKSRVFVMTGRNKEMKRTIDEISARDRRAVAVPFTPEVPLYMSAADVLLTKPGGLTTTEAAVLRIPLVLSAPIPGCESANAAFFEKKEMALCAPDERAAARAAMWLAADQEKSGRMIAAQTKEINPHAAEEICDEVLKADGRK